MAAHAPSPSHGPDYHPSHDHHDNDLRRRQDHHDSCHIRVTVLSRGRGRAALAVAAQARRLAAPRCVGPSGAWAGASLARASFKSRFHCQPEGIGSACTRAVTVTGCSVRSLERARDESRSRVNVSRHGKLDDRLRHPSQSTSRYSSCHGVAVRAGPCNRGHDHSTRA